MNTHNVLSLVSNIDYSVIQAERKHLQELKDCFSSMDLDEYKVLGLSKSNHHYLIQGLLGFAAAYKELVVVNSVAYIPYTSKALSRYLTARHAPGSHNKEVLRNKLKQICWNWRCFLKECTDSEIPEAYLSMVKEQQHEHDSKYHMKVYAITLLDFENIILEAVKDMVTAKQDGVTVPAKTKRFCIIANDGENVAQGVFGQDEMYIPRWQRQIQQAIWKQASKMYREHGVVTIQDLIADYILEDVIAREQVLKLKHGQVKTTIQGYIPGIMKKLHLTLGRVSKEFKEQYSYLELFGYNSVFYYKHAPYVYT